MTSDRFLFGDAVASLPDEFFDDDELMVHEIDSTPPRAGPVDCCALDGRRADFESEAEGRERFF